MSKVMSFGEGSSPVVYGDTLILTWDHEGPSFIFVLDKKTGKELWKKDRDEGTSWATPLVVEVDGKPQVIVSATKAIRSYDLATGEILWECTGMTRNVIPCPVYEKGTVYAMSGFRGSSLLAIDLAKASGDITDSEAVLWKYGKDTPYVPSPLLYEDGLYFLKVSNGTLTCMDTKTGKVHYGPKQLEGLKKGVYSSPVGAGKRVYLTGRDGTTVVFEQGPEFKVLATNTLDDNFSASAAVVGNEMFLRGFKHLYCIAEK